MYFSILMNVIPALVLITFLIKRKKAEKLTCISAVISGILLETADAIALTSVSYVKQNMEIGTVAFSFIWSLAVCGIEVIVITVFTKGVWQKILTASVLAAVGLILVNRTAYSLYYFFLLVPDRYSWILYTAVTAFIVLCGITAYIWLKTGILDNRGSRAEAK